MQELKGGISASVEKAAMDVARRVADEWKTKANDMLKVVRFCLL